MRGFVFLFVLVALLVACGSESESPSSVDDSSKPGGNAITEIPASEARSHVGERATICGNVVDSRYSSGSSGRPTFLNFEKAYPNHLFVVVIWGDDRSKFPSQPESHYRGERVCATGLIDLYSGKPQIIARSPSQLAIQ